MDVPAAPALADDADAKTFHRFSSRPDAYDRSAASSSAITSRVSSIVTGAGPPWKNFATSASWSV